MSGWLSLFIHHPQHLHIIWLSALLWGFEDFCSTTLQWNFSALVEFLERKRSPEWFPPWQPTLSESVRHVICLNRMLQPVTCHVTPAQRHPLRCKLGSPHAACHAVPHATHSCINIPTLTADAPTKILAPTHLHIRHICVDTHLFLRTYVL